MADTRYCMDCLWCHVVELKSGAYVSMCVNNEDGCYPEEVGYLSCACDGFESDYEDDEDDEEGTDDAV